MSLTLTVLIIVNVVCIVCDIWVCVGVWKMGKIGHVVLVIAEAVVKACIFGMLIAWKCRGEKTTTN